MTRDGTSKFRPADPALKLASGSNQPQPFERGVQSALAGIYIDIDLRRSQAKFGLIDLGWRLHAALQHNLQAFRPVFYFSCLNFPIRITGRSSTDPGSHAFGKLKAL